MPAGEHERGIEHAKDAVADKPKWSQTHLLLAQSYFASVVVSTKALKAEDRDAALTTSCPSLTTLSPQPTPRAFHT